MGGRGRLHSPQVKAEAIEVVQSTVAQGVSKTAACGVLGVSPKTLKRWESRKDLEDSRKGPNTPPVNQLTAAENEQLLELATLPEYRNLTPEQIVPKAIDDGRGLIASARTMRRRLKDRKMGARRDRTKPPTRRRPKEHQATGPMEVLCWDITHLKNSTVKGSFFYLYMFIDVWSRKIVAAEVHAEQHNVLAANLLAGLAREHQVVPNTTVLHSDNGSPMKGATMLATLDALGITKSFSRAQVSDDNPYIEALFRHLKYAPQYPSKGFATIELAREWVKNFVHWYNNFHLHSSIEYITPEQRHTGEDAEILRRRNEVYQAAKQRHPERWIQGRAHHWSAPDTVILNPERTVTLQPKSQQSAA